MDDMMHLVLLSVLATLGLKDWRPLEALLPALIDIMRIQGRRQQAMNLARSRTSRMRGGVDDVREGVER